MLVGTGSVNQGSLSAVHSPHFDPIPVLMVSSPKTGLLHQKGVCISDAGRLFFSVFSFRLDTITCGHVSGEMRTVKKKKINGDLNLNSTLLEGKRRLP